MMFSRRRMLQGALGAVGLVVAGTGWRAVDQGVFSAWEGAAYEPWRDWQGTAGARALVDAAILAASAHNTQPWAFAVRPDRIDLYADGARNLGTMDPFRRELHISLGCALENLCLSATAEGLRPAVTLAPDQAAGHAARVDLTPTPAATSALYDAIPRRHTDRGAYTDRPVEADRLTGLAALAEPGVAVRWLVDDGDRRTFANETIAATEAIIADREQSADSHRWFRHDWDAVQRDRDGVTLDASGNGRFKLAVAKVLPASDEGTNNGYFLAGTRDTQTRAPAFGLLAVRDPASMAGRLAVGRTWQRIHLAAVAAGLAAQPLNQLMERADREAQLGLAPRFTPVLKPYTGDHTAIFAFRLGHPSGNAHPSPRRSGAAVIR
jgi:hypothetical protein